VFVYQYMMLLHNCSSLFSCWYLALWPFISLPSFMIFLFLFLYLGCIEIFVFLQYLFQHVRLRVLELDSRCVLFASNIRNPVHCIRMA
jgi:hypothetical protein